MRTRREFSSETKRQAVRRSGGICECHLLGKRGIARFSSDGCGVAIGVANTFFEHINTSWHSGDDSLDNCAALTRTCWKIKTATHDLPKIAKTKRLQNWRFGIKSDSGRPLPGTRRSGIKLSLNPRSAPIDRATGREWRSR
jgi:hypothetical protein